MLLPILKGWAIDFTNAEKSVLYRFMGLYIGSMFILFAIIAYLFYTLAYSYRLDERRHAMQMYAHQLSSKIISAHMNGHKELDLSKLAKASSYRVAFFDKRGNRVAGVQHLQKDIQNPFYVDQSGIRIVDKSSFGHLGVAYIVIEDDSFGSEITKLKERTLLFLLLAYLLVLMVGYLLARLFIKPIQMRRRELDNFIKESTHELNTPVAALLMSVDAKGKVVDKNDERIKISARRISDVYKDLTYLFLRDKSPAYKEPLEMTALFREEVEILKPLAQKKGIHFEQTYQNRLIFEIDRESAVRLVTNLLSNAIKYNKRSGTVFITVIGREIFVRDTGIGISKKAQQEIFKRFFRATNYSGGFGLGLSIVSDISQRYGIVVTLDSEEGKGTTFRLRFP